MKKTLLFLFLCTSLTSIAQVTNEGEPASWKLSTKDAITAITLPQVNIQKIKNEDVINDKDKTKPYRIGVLQKVNYGLENAGTWTTLSNGDRIWRVLFQSKDAVHLSVVFDKFYIPKGGKLYLYNDSKTDLLGAYTAVQNNKEEVLTTWFVNGDTLWIEYYEPKEEKGRGKLNISSVIHGYRIGHTYQKGYFNDKEKVLNGSGDCNLDVNCPIGTDFENQKNLLKKAVAFLIMPETGSSSAFICSGTLINNTSQDKKPYFLTANHCFNNTASPSNYTFRFNWISANPICASTANSTNGPMNFTISGATLRARNANSDFMLVEINNPIPAAWDVTYAGWDRSDTTPSFVVGIHHPQGDIMKICRDDSGVIKAPHAAGGSPVAQTWEITTAGNGWELGVTEGGSSGSALFDSNGRIIGQLYGGQAACSTTSTTTNNGRLDFYGRFAVSWNSGSTSSLRLRDWLDPSGTNQTTLDAKENVLAVNDEFLEKNITLFPNPSSGVIQIRITGLVGDLNYEVYNLLGQTLLSSKLQNNEIIFLDNLPNDIYFVKIIEADTNRSLVKKIVLNK